MSSQRHFATSTWDPAIFIGYRTRTKKPRIPRKANWKYGAWLENTGPAILHGSTEGSQGRKTSSQAQSMVFSEPEESAEAAGLSCLQHEVGKICIFWCEFVCVCSHCVIIKRMVKGLGDNGARVETLLASRERLWRRHLRDPEWNIYNTIRSYERQMIAVDRFGLRPAYLSFHTHRSVSS